MIGGSAILACSPPAGTPQSRPPVVTCAIRLAAEQAGQSRRRAIGSRMAASSKIVLHHVGGRWGNHPFPRLPAFAGDFVEVLYEADTDAIAAIQEAGKDR